MLRCLLLLLPLLRLGWAIQPDPQALRRLYEGALAKREHVYGLADARTAAAARDLGLYLRKWGKDPEAAREALDKALAIDEKALGGENPQTLADAASLAEASAPGDAESLWRRVSVSPDYALAARAYAALGDMREAAGDRGGAAKLFELALEKEELVNGKMAERVAVRLNSLALVSDPPVAVSLLERALAINRQALGENHPETATTEVNLSGELLAVGRVGESVKLGQLALANFEATLGPQHPRTAAAASTLADALRASKNPANAEKLYRQALAIDEAAYGPNHPETLGNMKTLATFLRERGRLSEAEQLERRLSGDGK